MNTVTRYVPTHIGRSGVRTLMQAALGRNTYETPEQAQAWIDAVVKHNDPEALATLFGAPFEVRPCQCSADHFEPCSLYFPEVAT